MKMDMEYENEGVRRGLTASVGYTKHPGQTFDMKEAFSQTDLALYADKRSNKSN